MTSIRPYGDTLDDGRVQLSFTLPVPWSEQARRAALRLCEAMNIAQPEIAHAEDIGGKFTFFIVYGCTRASVEIDAGMTTEAPRRRHSREEVDAMAAEEIGRQLIVIGATAGADAHTVGLDSILSAKGYRGRSGLERYGAFRVVNLGSQVEPQRLVDAARDYQADALLVSQVVTQKGIHTRTLTELLALLETSGLRRRLVVILGGPRITHDQALQLGFDAGFGPGTTPDEVASCLLDLYLERTENA